MFASRKTTYLNLIKQTIVSSAKIMSGNTSQVIQNYGIDSLVGVSSVISDIREFHFRHMDDGRPLYKQIQQHPATDEDKTGKGHLSDQTFKAMFGKRAETIKENLLKHRYCTCIGRDSCILTWSFRRLFVDDFDIGLGPKDNTDIFHSLDSLLWTPLPHGETIDSFIKALKVSSKSTPEEAFRITDLEYWFRQGIHIVGLRFSSPPSPELISLINHKIHFIQQEKIENYFHIISSFNTDNMMWLNERNKKQRFFEIIGHLLLYTWFPFDMERCEVSIKASGDEGLIISGSLRMDFATNGTPSVHYGTSEKHFSTVPPGDFDFTVRNVALRASVSEKNSPSLSLHMVSRSIDNVDPRNNFLTHRFVKLLADSVGKLIDVIMPVVRREEALQNLKWRSFLDSLRLRTLEYGEDLHLIFSDFLGVIGSFFGISGVMIFSEDRDLRHMLNFFSLNDPKHKSYQLLKHPLGPQQILKKQLLLFPVREIADGRVILYFDLPKTGTQHPLNSERPEEYLTGTEVWNIVNKEARDCGITDLKDFLFFMVTECITANPKAALDNLSRRLSVQGRYGEADALMKLSRKILERLSHFFDLFQTFRSNLESGLAYMRGRRDNLTGLYNRQHFKSLLSETFSMPGEPLGLIFLDMDNFKIYNDAVNHDFGDKLLVAMANRMIDVAGTIGGKAVPGRFGGDEFCFSISGKDKKDFERKAIEVFKKITHKPLLVTFYFDDRTEGENMDINLISFLHRLMRPDVGSRQASRTEYIEMANRGSKNHLLDIWMHYKAQDGGITKGMKIRGEQIISEISAIVEDKILYNKIFREIDPEFSRLIQIFITLQLRNYPTEDIRKYLIKTFNGVSVKRRIALKVSAGLAHDSESRLRSMDSLFKAADSRSYLAKSNGRNCLFGINGERLA